MASVAVTVLGHDRPGLIADVTAALAQRGGNLADSSMTLLRGHFAWTLIVDTDAAPEELAADLAFLADRGLTATVMPLPDDQGQVVADGVRCVLSVHGADRVGIVAAVTRPVADVGGTITDLTTRLSGGLYVVIAELDLPGDADLTALADRIAQIGRELGVAASLRRPEEPDVL